MNKIRYFVVGVLVGISWLCVMIKKASTIILLTPIGKNVIIPHLRNMIADSTEFALYGDTANRKRKYFSYKPYSEYSKWRHSA